jgi:hypothetical protein
VGLGGLTGEIGPGLAADFLIVDIDTPEMVPSWDLVWNSSASATATRSRRS